MRSQIQISAIVDRIERKREALYRRVLRSIVPWWRDFDGWYDNGAVMANAARTADFVEKARVNQYRASQAGMRMLLSAMDVKVPPKPTELPSVGLDYGRDVMPLEAYSRPASQFRFFDLKDSDDEDASKPFEMALERLESVVQMDLADAARQGSEQPIKLSSEVVGYRRVIHPERSQSGVCGLCIVASGNFYKKSDLMPIHDNCKCQQMPVVKGQKDPGKTMNEEDLKRLYDEAGGNAAADLKRTRYEVVDGEFKALLIPKRRDGSGASKRTYGRSATGAQDEPIRDYESAIRSVSEYLAKIRAERGDSDKGVAYLENHLRDLYKKRAAQAA